MKKYIKTIVIFAVIIFLICILPFPIKVDKVLSGVDFYLDEPTNVKKDKFIIKGTYFKYLLRDDTFRGDFRIEGADLDFDLQLVNDKIVLNNYRSSVHYFCPMFYSKSRNEMVVLGSFYVKDIFDEIYVSYNNADINWFVAPAENRESAIEKMKQDEDMSFFLNKLNSICY